MQLVTTTSPADDLAEAMRQFIIDQGEGRTDETKQRYVQVADDLATFIVTVDVRPWLGPELAELLARERRRIGGNALLTSLGLVSFIRVLPAFCADPWLPAAGMQRRTQRAATRHLLTFLRFQAHQRGCYRRDDFASIEKSLGRSYASDHRAVTQGRTGTVTCSVTLDLIQHLVDRMLEEIEEGRHDSFGEAIAARINPVPRTVWEEPGHATDYRYEW